MSLQISATHFHSEHVERV